MGFGVVKHEKYIDESRFGIGFDVDTVCDELKKRGYTDVKQMHVNNDDPNVVRISIAYVGRATIIYDDAYKVVRVNRNS